MVKRRYMATRIVKPGMVIDQAIIDRAGRVLIARKTELDDYLIEALMKMGVPGIYIREGEEEDEDIEKEDPVINEAIQKQYEQIKVADRAKVRLTESVRKRVAEGVQYLYQDTNSSSFVSETRNITNDLMKAITDNDAIAVDISALKISDEYTFKHSVDVATMSMIVAKRYGFTKEQVYEIGLHEDENTGFYTPFWIQNATFKTDKNGERRSCS